MGILGIFPGIYEILTKIWGSLGAKVVGQLQKKNFPKKFKHVANTPQSFVASSYIAAKNGHCTFELLKTGVHFL